MISTFRLPVLAFAYFPVPMMKAKPLVCERGITPLTGARMFMLPVPVAAVPAPKLTVKVVPVVAVTV